MSFLSKNNKDKNRGKVGNVPVFGEDGTFVDSGTTPNGEGSSPLTYSGGEAELFHRGCFLGDSIIAGLVVGVKPDGTPWTDQGHTNEQNGVYSLCEYFEKRFNVPVYNAGLSGTTIPELRTAMTDSTTRWGKWGHSCWTWDDVGSTSLDLTDFDFYVLHVGLNDIWQGAEPATVYNNMISLIDFIRSSHPKAPVFICTDLPADKYSMPQYEDKVDTFNNMIRAIDKSDCYCIDLDLYSKVRGDGVLYFDHPTALGYMQLGKEIGNGISYIINKNPEKFKFQQLVYAENPYDFDQKPFTLYRDVAWTYRKFVAK